MTLRVESASLLRPEPHKDHDRIFVDEERRIFAVFDGANNVAASELAVSALRNVVRNRDSFGLDEAFGMMQFVIRTRLDGNYLTTGSVIRLSEEVNGQATLEFASAGDSPIYSFNHDSGELSRLTEDESIRIGNQIDARNFLGSRYHSLRQYGRAAIESATTFVLMTDGITEPEDPGRVTNEKLAEILASQAAPEQIAKDIMVASTVRDDASVIVASVHL